MHPEFNSPEQRHRETLALLQEVVEYLQRLPKVPVGEDLRKKLEAHLEAPDLSVLLKQQDTLRASAVTPSGFVLLEARLTGNELVVGTPPFDDRAAMLMPKHQVDRAILQRLETGVRFQLRNCGYEFHFDSDGDFDEG